VQFTPDRGLLNPKLNIAGTSEVGDHKINLLVHGDTASPGTSLTSTPPLPESEIMSLIATGETTSSLANADTLALKAFQLLLLKLEQRKTFYGGNKLFGAMRKGLDKLNLDLGDDDNFSGRDFISANIDLAPKWLLTTQVDDEQEARGLLVYLIRFK